MPLQSMAATRDRPGIGRRRTLLIEGIEIPGGIAHDLLDATLGNRNASEFGDGVHRFLERIEDSRLDQAPLQFVGERASRQGQGLIERIDTRCARLGVAEALDLHRPKDGGYCAGAEAAVGVTQRDVIGTGDGQGGADIAVTALVQVGLQQQTL